ncbi:MAG: hemolysin family protein [Thermosynechococcaceae cyanobacterium]
MALTHPEIFSSILAILVLIAINAFFVAAEFAVVSVRRTRIQQLVQEGDLQAKTVQRLQRDIERLLSTTQLGITLSSLALGWMSEKAIAQLLFDWLDQSQGQDATSRWIAHSLAVPIAFIAIAYIQIVLGELCPKTLALAYPEQLARFLGPISLSISQLFAPLVWILNQSNRRLLKILRVPFVQDSSFDSVTAKELQLILEASSEHSDLHDEKRELLKNVFESGETLVEEVMVPRTSIHAIESQFTLGEFLSEVSQTGHDYYPVIDESLDRIRGIIYYKDVLREISFESLNLEISIQPWIQTAWFVSEGTSIQDVLQMMQKYQLGAVMVRESEFNGTAGLITFQDLMRSIIGLEEEDSSPQDLQITEQDNHTFTVQAQTDLEVVQEEVGIEFPISEDYQTLGGFIIFYLQKIPEPGEIFHYQNFEITVLSNEGPRLDQILIRRLDIEANLPDDSSDDHLR